MELDILKLKHHLQELLKYLTVEFSLAIGQAITLSAHKDHSFRVCDSIVAK